MIGTKVGGYDIRSKLGRGGMGEVYKAYDSSLDRFVAIKILPKDLATDEKLRLRFVKEARALGKVTHPNLVHIYAVGEEDGVNFFAMEYVDGWTLTRLVKHWKRLTPIRSFTIVGEVMAALSKVHESGLIHRDIKPGNVMVDRNGRVVLMDFGLAKLADSEDATQLTTAGMIIGTPQYVSPEQARGEVIDARSDIYSLGVVLYEMLTGDPPYKAKSAMGVLMRHINDPVPELKEVLPDVAPEVERVVSRAMQKAVDERYQKLPDMAADMLSVARTKSLMSLVPEDVRRNVRTGVTSPGTEAAPGSDVRLTDLPTSVSAPTVAVQRQTSWLTRIGAAAVMLFLVMVVLVGLLLVLPRKGKAAIRGTAVTKDGKRVQGEIMSYDPKKKALKVRAKGKSPEWVSLEELSTIEIERPLKK